MHPMIQYPIIAARFQNSTKLSIILLTITAQIFIHSFLQVIRNIFTNNGFESESVSVLTFESKLVSYIVSLQVICTGYDS